MPAAGAAADRGAEDEDRGDGNYLFHFSGLSISRELSILLPTWVVCLFVSCWRGGGGDSASRRLLGSSTRRSGLVVDSGGQRRG